LVGFRQRSLALRWRSISFGLVKVVLCRAFAGCVAAGPGVVRAPLAIVSWERKHCYRQLHLRALFDCLALFCTLTLSAERGFVGIQSAGARGAPLPSVGSSYVFRRIRGAFVSGVVVMRRARTTNTVISRQLTRLTQQTTAAIPARAVALRRGWPPGL